MISDIPTSAPTDADQREPRAPRSAPRHVILERLPDDVRKFEVLTLCDLAQLSQYIFIGEDRRSSQLDPPPRRHTYASIRSDV